MKFGVLKSIGHNIADSAASGLGFPIGYYAMDVFQEAQASPDGRLVVDFLSGAVLEGVASDSLAKAFDLYRGALAELCERHGGGVTDFGRLEVVFSLHPVYGNRFDVTIEDRAGKSATDSYFGTPGRKLRKARALNC